MMQHRRSLVGRDQAASPFSAILMRLCEGTSAIGAAFVDSEGETVDYAGHLDPFQTKVAAAEWRLVLRVIHQSKVPTWTDTRELVVRAQLRSYAAFAVSEGYAIVVCLPRRCFTVSPRAVAEAVREICAESGLDLPPDQTGEHERWISVDVRTPGDDRLRPVAVWHGGSWCPLEILGRYTDDALASHEVGYRARLDTGAEFTLVRERRGRWYADDLPV